jgi:hypothetical protein
MSPARALGAALLLATANTAYLTWRYLAVRHGWSAPGAGLCSWTAWVDCDRVLQSAEARWFFVPNAVLGMNPGPYGDRRRRSSMGRANGSPRPKAKSAGHGFMLLVS